MRGRRWRIGHFEPLEQHINALLPLLLHKVQLCNGELSVDLHCQGDIGLSDHIAVGLQRTWVVLVTVINKSIQIVNVGQLIAVQFSFTLGFDHAIENTASRRPILQFCGGLCLCQFLVDRIA